MVGISLVTMTVSIIDYPKVASAQVTFNLTVINNCQTAKISSNAQSLAKMIYYPMISTAPTIQVFMPFSDNVANLY
jgi:hypothetical protein